MVERLDRRGRVVDGRRQGLVGDVDDDPDGERRVLLDCALIPSTIMPRSMPSARTPEAVPP